jgi:hypothetical protein
VGLAPRDDRVAQDAQFLGDWQLYVPAAAFLYDVAGFSAKWLRDVAADQWDDGTIANMSPAAPAEGAGSPAGFLNGSAGWGDAIVIVPWELYRAYGDVQLLVPPATPVSRPASGPRGRPSSSARTATSVRPPRPISCGR